MIQSKSANNNVSAGIGIEEQYDVLVIGAGNAALTAALSAHEASVKVCVVEKAPKKLRGGNTRFSGGLFRFAYAGIEDVKTLMPSLQESETEEVDVGSYSAQDYYKDIMRVTEGEAEPKLTRITGEESFKTMKWMSKKGLRWEFTSLWAVRTGKKTKFTPGSLLQAKGKGVGLCAMLFQAVEQANIPVLYETQFTELLLNQDGEIRGANVRTPRGVRTLACRTIVLACGGFEASSAMRMHHLGHPWKDVKVRGTEYNTGEGLQAALNVGARPAGQWEGCHATPIDAKAPEVGDLRLTDLTNRLSYPFGIMVNTDSKRFVDEGEDFGQYTYAKIGGAILDQPQALAFQIFDSKTVDLLEKRYDTANAIVAGSMAELAKRLRLEPRALANTVMEFNASVQPGQFTAGIRDGKCTKSLQPRKSNWAVPVDTPPYTAYGVTCGITFTFGGLEINSKGQVLNVSGTPIPGLYATGEITGKFFYHNYAGGSGLMRGAVFGRLAGTYAAAESKT